MRKSRSAVLMLVVAVMAAGIAAHGVDWNADPTNGAMESAMKDGGDAPIVVPTAKIDTSCNGVAALQPLIEKAKNWGGNVRLSFDWSKTGQTVFDKTFSFWRCGNYAPSYVWSPPDDAPITYPASAVFYFSPNDGSTYLLVLKVYLDDSKPSAGVGLYRKSPGALLSGAVVASFNEAYAEHSLFDSLSQAGDTADLGSAAWFERSDAALQNIDTKRDPHWISYYRCRDNWRPVYTLSTQGEEACSKEVGIRGALSLCPAGI